MLSAELDFVGSIRVDEEVSEMAFLNEDGAGDPAAGRRSHRLVGYEEIERLLESGGEATPCAQPGEDTGGAAFPPGCRRALKAEAEAEADAKAGAPAKQFCENARVSLFPDVGSLAVPGAVFPPDKSVSDIYEALNADKAITEFTVVDAGNAPLGFMTRSMVNELLGGRYGFWLNSKRKIGEAAHSDFLKVGNTMPIDYVTKLAMQRPYESLYNPIVVVNESGYYGVVTIKDLLNAYTKVEVEAAISANPLTKLPGNLIIEGEIMRRIFGKDPYCVIYIDIDNFKAYNDAYGFENGDLILKFVADIMKSCAANGEFVGHIGGDDFIVICDYHDGSGVCREIIQKFAAGINSFYRDVDLENGFIVSTNRHGVVDSFPIASLSIAGISNKSTGNLHISEFSKAIAQLKKKCKKHTGNYFEIV